MSDAEFDRFASDYDRTLQENVGFFDADVAYFAEYKVQRLRALLGDSHGKLLDFGCGIGRSIGYLQRYFPNARVFGTDPSPDSLEQAAAAHPDAGFFPLDELGDQAERFDVALAANVFHHIPPSERVDAVAGIVGRLAPGGGIAIFEHNPRNPLTRKLVKDCPFDKDAVLLDIRETRALLQDAGLEIVKQGYRVFFPGFVAMLRPLERYLEWLPLGGQYFVYARRRGASS